MKQHYVPASYLRAFTDPACPPNHEPYLWVVDLDDGTIRRRAPENTAKLTDYYKIGDGEDRNAVEGYLSAVESRVAPVLVTILGDASTFDSDEKAALSTFAAVQVVRVPQFRSRIEVFMTGIAQQMGAMLLLDPDSYARAVQKTFPGREFTAAELDEMYEGARQVGPDAIRANPQAALGHALRVVPMIANIMSHMSWAVMVPPGSENFWTSDNPVLSA